MFESVPFAKRGEISGNINRAYLSYLKAKSPKDKHYFLEIVNENVNRLFYQLQTIGFFFAKMEWRETWCLVADYVRPTEPKEKPYLLFYDIDPDVIVLPYLLGTELEPPVELPKNGIYIY
ncbi:hypothetical protein [Mesotoga prima]|uniref:hypothetical protein n=1 Tax=Mesotoga prima TaxID=1184387 RepID=UPI001BD6BAE8